MDTFEKHKDLMEVLDSAILLHKEVPKMLEDGLGFNDIAPAIKLLRSLNVAIKDIHKIYESYKDMTIDEAEEINAYCDEKFDLENDAVEEIIESVFDWLIQTAATFDLLKASKKK